MAKKKSSFHSSQLSNQKIVRCFCGAEILLINDVKKMGHAIEAHAHEHQRMEKNPIEGKNVFRNVVNVLAKSILERAAFEGNWKE
jgi:hypothetical protein